MLDKFVLIAHSKIFTLNKDIDQNDKVKSFSGLRFKKTFWSISLIRVKLMLCVKKANLFGMQF